MFLDAEVQCQRLAADFAAASPLLGHQRPRYAAAATDQFPTATEPVGRRVLGQPQPVERDAAVGGEALATGGAGEGALAAVPLLAGDQVALWEKAAAAACCRSLPWLAALPLGIVFFNFWGNGVLVGLRIYRDGDHS